MVYTRHRIRTRSHSTSKGPGGFRGTRGDAKIRNCNIKLII
jgi:hypothetical protein